MRANVNTDEIERCAAVARALRAEIENHPYQPAVLEDRSPLMAICCTRQAGKTDVLSHRLFDTNLTRPGAYSAYFNTSKDECRNALWERADRCGIQSTIERLKIPCRTNDTRMTVWIPGMSSKFKLIGMDDESETKKARGPVYDDGIIDEAQGMPFVRKLAIDALLPGTIKRKGSVIMAGTPPEVQEGNFFFDVTREDGAALPGWSVHRFTIFDNPGIPHAAEYVERIRIANGWTLDDPTYLREFCGKHVANATQLVYRLASVPRERRYYDKLPDDIKHDWRFLIGVDLGFFPDPFAVVVWAYCDDIPVLFEIDSQFHEGTDTHQQAQLLGSLIAKYKPERTVCDAGSGGLKQIVVGDWQGRYGLPVDVADKANKDSAIEAFNADIIAGRIKFRKDSPLERQMLGLPWRNKIGSRRQEDPKVRNDMCDAGLYAYRESHFFEGKPPEPTIDPGTPEFVVKEMSDYRERLIRDIDQENDEPVNIYDMAGDDDEWTDWNR